MHLLNEYYHSIAYLLISIIYYVQAQENRHDNLNGNPSDNTILTGDLNLQEESRVFTPISVAQNKVTSDESVEPNSNSRFNKNGGNIKIVKNEEISRKYSYENKRPAEGTLAARRVNIVNTRREQPHRPFQDRNNRNNKLKTLVPKIKTKSLTRKTRFSQNPEKVNQHNPKVSENSDTVKSINNECIDHSAECEAIYEAIGRKCDNSTFFGAAIQYQCPKTCKECEQRVTKNDQFTNHELTITLNPLVQNPQNTHLRPSSTERISSFIQTFHSNNQQNRKSQANSNAPSIRKYTVNHIPNKHLNNDNLYERISGPAQDARQHGYGLGRPYGRGDDDYDFSDDFEEFGGYGDFSSSFSEENGFPFGQPGGGYSPFGNRFGRGGFNNLGGHNGFFGGRFGGNNRGFRNQFGFPYGDSSHILHNGFGTFRIDSAESFDTIETNENNDGLEKGKKYDQVFHLNGKNKQHKVLQRVPAPENVDISSLDNTNASDLEKNSTEITVQNVNENNERQDVIQGPKRLVNSAKFISFAIPFGSNSYDEDQETEVEKESNNQSDALDSENVENANVDDSNAQIDQAEEEKNESEQFRQRPELFTRLSVQQSPISQPTLAAPPVNALGISSESESDLEASNENTTTERFDNNSEQQESNIENENTTALARDSNAKENTEAYNNNEYQNDQSINKSNEYVTDSNNTVQDQDDTSNTKNIKSTQTDNEKISENIPDETIYQIVNDE